MRSGSVSTISARMILTTATKLRPRHFAATREATKVTDGIASTFDDWGLRTHPLLPMSQASQQDTEVVFLGHVIDPRQPLASNIQVARAVARCSSFDAVEQATKSLAGRWVLFARIASESRLYPDATASKSVFYDATQVASHPVHMGYGPDRSLASFPMEACTWPMDRTPYPDVRQLLPNHYLDLATMRPVRFGPKQAPPVSLNDAVVKIGALLRGTIEAVAQRGSVAIPITGGRDTRTLLTAATGLPIRYFTVINESSPHHDLAVPPKIARRLGLDWRFVDGRTADFPAEELMGGIWRDANSSSIGAFKQADFVVWGHASHIIRCQYWQDGIRKEVNPKSLTWIAGFGDSEWAEAIFADWLTAVPDSIYTLDLFYWEYRAGVWASLTGTAFDYFCDAIAPFNCGELIEIGLGVEDAYRRQSPDVLFDRLCLPALSAFPVNSTWWERLDQRLPSWFPWRLRQAIGNKLRQRIPRVHGPVMHAPSVEYVP